MADTAERETCLSVSRRGTRCVLPPEHRIRCSGPRQENSTHRERWGEVGAARLCGCGDEMSANLGAKCGNCWAALAPLPDQGLIQTMRRVAQFRREYMLNASGIDASHIDGSCAAFEAVARLLESPEGEWENFVCDWAPSWRWGEVKRDAPE